MLLVLIAWSTRGWWSVAIAKSLVCDADAAPSDAILVENFDPDYRLFERANALRQSGLAQRVLVPVAAGPNATELDAVGAGIAEVMAKAAQLGAMDILLVREVEPISLNAAFDIRRYLEQEGIKSVIVLSPLFRSQRSALVYDATLSRTGIEVTCEPVAAGRQIESWTLSWHGVQDVMEQWIKLQYYRLYVLPLKVRES